jgi:hypothetical protein
MKFVTRSSKMDRGNVVANAIRAHLGHLVDCLCGCSHRRTTFPITLRAKVTVDRKETTDLETYVVCVECGRQFAYDWTTMQMSRQSPGRATDQRVTAGDRPSARFLPLNGLVTSAGAGRR